MGTSSSFGLRLLLWLYYPFLALVVVALVLGEVILVKLLLRLPELAMMRTVVRLPVLVILGIVLLAIPLGHIVWACQCLFWRLPDEGEDEVRLPKATGKRLFEFAARVADEQGLTRPNKVRLTATTEAYAYENAAGDKILVLGGLVIRAFSQNVLAGIIAHELAHFTGGDTTLSRQCYRRRVLMQLLDSKLLLWIRPSEHDTGIIVHPSFWLFLNVMNPMPWLIVAYHRLFYLLEASNSRLQEYAADAFCLAHAGKKATANALLYTHVTQYLPWANLEAIAESYVEANTHMDQLFAEQAERAGRVDPHDWQQACKKALRQKTGLLDSHPCLKDRLAAIGMPAKAAMQLKLDQTGPPATDLFDDWKSVEQRLSAELMSHVYENWQDKQDAMQIQRALAKRDEDIE